MDFLSFSGAIAFLGTADYNYWLYALGLFVGGTAVSSAGGFLAALGYMHFWPVLGLAFAIDFLNDFIYYWIGRAWRAQVIEKYRQRLGISERVIYKLDAYMRAHSGKTLAISKFVPLIPTLVLLLAGAARAPLLRFGTVAFFATIPRAFIFVSLGYYFGVTYDAVVHYVDRIELALLFLALAVTGIILLYRRTVRIVTKKIEALPD